uniref:Transposase (Putative), gypsy type n=1 Tax=Tanacetum cinerariifolium TaxID=118510 RepID=A0A6L2MC60_TANCI|nr:hypothetical protein [Tanacetum cinerariifolium]
MITVAILLTTRVLLLKRTQTIFDGPLGFVRMIKLITFAIMCKAYGGEPSVDLLRAFLNLGLTSNLLTLSNRVPSEYSELLLEDIKLDKNSFKDVLPTYAQDDPLYHQISTYPCNVRTFSDPILYLIGLKTSWKHSPKIPIIYYREKDGFRSFMMEGIDGEFHFIPEGGAGYEGSFPSTKSVNNEAPTINAEPLTVVHPSKFAKNIGLLRGNLDRRFERFPQASKVGGDAFDPLDVGRDPNILEFPSAKELKDSADCHFVVAHVTPPSWKQHLKEISLEKLCDIHGKAYMRQAILDNMLNNKTRKLMSTSSKDRDSCDVIREMEVEKDKAYAELERKCNKALHDLDENPLVLDMRLEAETLQGQVDKLHNEYSRLVLEEKKWLLQEVVGLRQDMSTVVSKVVPHVAMELVHSDEIGLLVARLVKAAMFYGKCTALKEVANLKEPFNLEKMLGYRSSSKKEFDQADDDLATAFYAFIAEASADPYASLKELLLKKPKSICTKLAPLNSKPSSLRALTS